MKRIGGIEYSFTGGYEGAKKLSHRDYLGAFMNLGIKREKIGDILAGDVFCNVVIMSEIAKYVRYNLHTVGEIRVSGRYYIN